MLPVNISYGPWSYSGDLPQHLGEVAPVMRGVILKALVNPNQPSARQTITRTLFGISRKLWAAFPKDVQVSLCDITADFGFGESCTPLLESFTHRGITYALPRADGENIRSLEFALADSYLRQVIEAPTDEALLKLVATYAREVESNEQLADRRSDNRVPLVSTDQVERRAKKLAGIDPAHAAVVVTYAVGLKKLIHEMYGPHIFDAPAGAKEGPQFGASSFDLGWWGTFMRVAKEGAFGVLSDVHQSFVHDICSYLAQERSDAKARASAQPKK